MTHDYIVCGFKVCFFCVFLSSFPEMRMLRATIKVTRFICIKKPDRQTLTTSLWNASRQSTAHKDGHLHAHAQMITHTQANTPKTHTRTHKPR
jgi:hypothetical protein